MKDRYRISLRVHRFSLFNRVIPPKKVLLDIYMSLWDILSRELSYAKPDDYDGVFTFSIDWRRNEDETDKPEKPPYRKRTC